MISYGQFQEMELKVGKIIAAEEIEGADKLYKLTVSLGGLETSLVAGIKLYYSKEELLGKKVMVLVNLEPKVIRGIESRGMVLAASSEDRSQVVLLSPEKDIPEGSTIK